MEDITSHIMKFYSTPIRDIYYQALYPLPHKVGKIAILPQSRNSPILGVKDKYHLFLHSYFYCGKCGEYKPIKSIYPIDQIEKERRCQLITPKQYLDRIHLYLFIIESIPCNCREIKISD
jgi:hypothetical protein